MTDQIKIKAELGWSNDGIWEIDVGCSYDKFEFKAYGITGAAALANAYAQLPDNYVIEIIETP